MLIRRYDPYTGQVEEIVYSDEHKRGGDRGSMGLGQKLLRLGLAGFVGFLGYTYALKPYASEIVVPPDVVSILKLGSHFLNKGNIKDYNGDEDITVGELAEGFGINLSEDNQSSLTPAVVQQPTIVQQATKEPDIQASQSVVDTLHSIREDVTKTLDENTPLRIGLDVFTSLNPIGSVVVKPIIRQFTLSADVTYNERDVVNFVFDKTPDLVINGAVILPPTEERSTLEKILQGDVQSVVGDVLGSNVQTTVYNNENRYLIINQAGLDGKLTPIAVIRPSSQITNTSIMSQSIPSEVPVLDQLVTKDPVIGMTTFFDSSLNPEAYSETRVNVKVSGTATLELDRSEPIFKMGLKESDDGSLVLDLTSIQANNREDFERVYDRISEEVSLLADVSEDSQFMLTQNRDLVTYLTFLATPPPKTVVYQGVIEGVFQSNFVETLGEFKVPLTGITFRDYFSLTSNQFRLIELYGEMARAFIKSVNEMRKNDPNIVPAEGLMISSDRNSTLVNVDFSPEFTGNLWKTYHSGVVPNAYASNFFTHLIPSTMVYGGLDRVIPELEAVLHTSKDDLTFEKCDIVGKMCYVVKPLARLSPNVGQEAIFTDQLVVVYKVPQISLDSTTAEIHRQLTELQSQGVFTLPNWVQIQITGY